MFKEGRIKMITSRIDSNLPDLVLFKSTVLDDEVNSEQKQTFYVTMQKLNNTFYNGYSEYQAPVFEYRTLGATKSAPKNRQWSETTFREVTEE